MYLHLTRIPWHLFSFCTTCTPPRRMHIKCSVCVRGWVIVFLGTSVHDVGCSVAFSGGMGWVVVSE